MSNVTEMHKFSLKPPLERKRLPNYRLFFKTIRINKLFERNSLLFNMVVTLLVGKSYQGQKEFEQKICY